MAHAASWKSANYSRFLAFSPDGNWLAARSTEG